MIPPESPSESPPADPPTRHPVGAPLRHVPLALVGLRAVLAPVVVALALSSLSGGWIVATLAVALLTDVFDGVIARRLGVATPRLRRLDSGVDTLFYVGVLAAVVLRYPDVLRLHAVGLVVLAALETTRYAFDLWKHRRAASYHMWSAKAWGLALAVGLSALFGWEATGWPVGLAVWLGVVTDLEGLAASVVLSRPHTDVPSVVHAVRLERAEQAAARDAARRTREQRRGENRRWGTRVTDPRPAPPRALP